MKSVPFNNLQRHFLKFQEEYEEKAISVLRSGAYVLGNEMTQFEKEFSEFVGSNFTVGLNSGLDALILAFRALDIKEGDEVIVPANTYIASVLGITENGATPVFVEPDEYFALDPVKIESAITSRTKAILVVHLYGQSAQMDIISHIAKKHDLYLVEDCAQSHGSRFGVKMTGTFGDVGCFSFYPTKNLGAFGDGGAIVTSNEDIAKSVKMLRNYGSVIRYQNEVEGVNSRLDEIQAGLLRIKLKHFPLILKSREAIASKYLQGIKNPNVILPKVRVGSNHTWHLFVVKVSNRDSFQDFLSKNGIQTVIHYPIPPHLSNAYKRLGFREGDFKITEDFARSVVSLPVFDGMNEDEVDYVIDVVNKWI